MAPFGKNFLKARMKNRAKDAESPAAAAVTGKEIQVSVCSEEKVVCGVTKHTTCADMVQALLEDHGSLPEDRRLLLLRGGAGTADFCLVERWKGFERALPPLTRILRLWNAWGDQRPFVRFALVRSGDSVPQAARKSKPRAARAKRDGERGPSQRDHHHQQLLPQPQPQAHPQAQPLVAERQKRMVKKAFRKLEKLHRHRERSSRPAVGAEEIERMVQLILSQDHALREQAAHMAELDADLRKAEPPRGAGAGWGSATGCPTRRGGLEEVVEEDEDNDDEVRGEEEQLQAFLRATEGLEQVELQLQEHQALILQLSRDIDAELTGTSPSPSPSCSSWDAREEAVMEAVADPSAALWLLPPPGTAADPSAQLERARAELRWSMAAGARLCGQTTALDAELRRRDDAIAGREQECWWLAEQLSGLQVEGRGTVVEGSMVIKGTVDVEGCLVGGDPFVGSNQVRCVPVVGGGPVIGDDPVIGGSPVVGGNLEVQAVTVKHSLFPADVTDTDSDTGFSSTHSQDSLLPGLDFPLPLDTDV